LNLDGILIEDSFQTMDNKNLIFPEKNTSDAIGSGIVSEKRIPKTSASHDDYTVTQ